MKKLFFYFLFFNLLFSTAIFACDSSPVVTMYSPFQLQDGNYLVEIEACIGGGGSESGISADFTPNNILSFDPPSLTSTNGAVATGSLVGTTLSYAYPSDVANNDIFVNATGGTANQCFEFSVVMDAEPASTSSFFFEGVNCTVCQGSCSVGATGESSTGFSPKPCNDIATLELVAEDPVCNDNGTDDINADDTFTVTVNYVNSGALPVQDSEGNLLIGTGSITYGPYNSFDGSVNVTYITDESPDCEILEFIPSCLFDLSCDINVTNCADIILEITSDSECETGLVVDYELMAESNCLGSNLQIGEVLSNFNSNNGDITIPNGFLFSDGETGTCIIDGGSDMYDCGNRLFTNLDNDIPYSNNFITLNPNFGPSGAYFTSKAPGLFMLAADVDNISSFGTQGNNGADGGGTASGFTSTATIGTASFDLFVKTVCSAGDPSINQIVFIPSPNSASQTFAANTNDGEHTVSGITASTTRIYYLLFAGTGGQCYTQAEIETIADEFLVAIGEGQPENELTFNLVSGLASGSTFPFGTTTVEVEVGDTEGNPPTLCSFDVIITDPNGFCVTIDPPIPSITCPPLTLNICDGSYDCEIQDLNPGTNQNGVTDSPIFGGTAAFAIDNDGILDTSLLTSGVTYTIILNYAEDGVLGVPVSCTFTADAPNPANGGSF